MTSPAVSPIEPTSPATVAWLDREDATWPERYALGVFVLATPLGLVLSTSEADAITTILVVDGLAALAAWLAFRLIAARRGRRA